MRTVSFAAITGRLAARWDAKAPSCALARMSALATAFARRQELRKQKWNIKSIELQLRAAKNLARPQFNFISSYQMNGFGQHLFGDNAPVGTSQENLMNYTRNLLQANQTGWNVGFQFAVPLGLRNAHAQMRNTELRLTKAQTVLESQEMEVNHEIAGTFQNHIERT